MIVGHSDSYLDLDVHLIIGHSGATVGSDQIEYYGRSAWRESTLIAIITELVSQGSGGRVVLSCYLDRKPQLRAFGDPGYTYVGAVFIPRLIEAGINVKTVRMMLVYTSRRLLEPEPVQRA